MSFKIKLLSLTVSYITKLTILYILLHMFAASTDSKLLKTRKRRNGKHYNCAVKKAYLHFTAYRQLHKKFQRAHL